MGVERTQAVAMRRAALWVRWSAAMCVGPSLCTRHAGILQHRRDEVFVQRKPSLLGREKELGLSLPYSVAK